MKDNNIKEDLFENEKNQNINFKIIPSPYSDEDIKIFFERNNIKTYDSYINNLSNRINFCVPRINMFYNLLSFEKAIQDKELNNDEKISAKYFSEINKNKKEDLLDILNDKDETKILLNNFNNFVNVYEENAIEQLQKYYRANKEYYDYETLQNKFENMTKEEINDNIYFSPLISSHLELAYVGNYIMKELSDILKDNIKFDEMER